MILVCRRENPEAQKGNADSKSSLTQWPVCASCNPIITPEPLSQEKGEGLADSPASSPPTPLPGTQGKPVTPARGGFCAPERTLLTTRSWKACSREPPGGQARAPGPRPPSSHLSGCSLLPQGQPHGPQLQTPHSILLFEPGSLPETQQTPLGGVSRHTRHCHAGVGLDVQTAPMGPWARRVRSVGAEPGLRGARPSPRGNPAPEGPAAADAVLRASARCSDSPVVGHPAHV